jgi:GT2 family glycosyltransferase
MYCEEVDWCIRIRRDGWQIFCEPQAAIVHHGGASTRQVADRMFVELHRSRMTLFRRHYNPFFRVAARAITAAGLIWEYGRWAALYARGAVPWERFAGRRRACLAVAGLLMRRA